MTSGIYGYWDTLKDEIVYVGQSVNLKKRLRSHIEPARVNYQKISEESKLKMRNNRNATGFYNVHKEKTPQRKSEFTLRYTYYNKKGKRRRISSVSIFKLKQKVLAKGLPWKIIDESLANQIIQNELGVQS